MANDRFTDFMGGLFIQDEGPATEPKPLFCYDFDSLDAPLGDVATGLCNTPARGNETAFESQGAPSRATFSLASWLSKHRDYLQKKAQERCPVTIYTHHSDCGAMDVFLNYDVGQAGQYGYITSRNRGNQVKGMRDEGQTATGTTQGYDLSARPEPPEYWKLFGVRRAIVEDEQLRDIAFCNSLDCGGGGCGGYQAICDEGIIVADAATGVTAEVWFTVDGGITWVSSTTDPFIADEDVCSCVCVHTGKTSVRHIVYRGTTDGANPAEIGYSDDAGLTWTNVNTGATAGEYGAHSGALFALNHSQSYIWACTDQGEVYFSSDAGATWAAQGAGAADVLNYVHFIDPSYGWTVGDNQVLLRTIDGGVAWAAPAALPAAATDDFTCCATISANRAWVAGTTNAGAGMIYLTVDAGVTWTNYLARLQAAENFEGAIANIGDVKFLDEFAGSVTGTVTISGSDYVGVWRTIDGGWFWEFHYYDAALDGAVAYQGGNALWMCDYNHIYAVGELIASTGLVYELRPIGAVS